MARRNGVVGVTMGPPAVAGRRIALALLLVAGLSSAGCGARSSARDAVDVAWHISPTPPVVGQATLTVTLRDDTHAPVRGATLRVAGHMTHPGMAPVLATATERAPGVYETRLQLSMAGDWVLVVTAVLADGGRVSRQIEVSNVQPAG